MGLINLPEESINFFKCNLDEIFKSGNLAEGPWNKKLSDLLIDITSADVALPTNSNGAGMVALLNIFRYYYARTNVLIQSNTMYGVKTMVYSGGCSLSGFIPCQLETLMPSIQDVKVTIEQINQKERNKLVILLSHIGGIINPDIEEIAELCNNENIILLEDCAHSFGSTLYGKHSGLFGNAGVYSFYATKAIPAGEGGIVVTNDHVLGEMISSYSIYDRFEQKLEIGSNIRISEVQALLIYSVIKEYVHIVDNKQKMANLYITVCKELGIPFISQNENGQKGNHYKFTIYKAEMPIVEFLPKLKTITSAIYDYMIGVENPLADYHACLPIWYNQDNKVVDQVIKELKQSVH